MPTVSLLITTYNWPEALALCLQSVRNQSLLPEEVIIADDGSREDTRKLIETENSTFPIPLHHVWQPDEGFQLCKIRNKGIAKSSSEYIIQIDGDVILHKHFVRDHLSFAKANTFVSGSRVSLSKDSSSDILKHQTVLGIGFSYVSSLNGFRNTLLRNLFASFYKNSGRHTYYVKGCNMAFWRQDAIRVNAYNEAFIGWGPEDSEFAARLLNAGLQKRFIKFGGVMYHLYHKEADRNRENANYTLLHSTIESKSTFCTLGINQYLENQAMASR